MSILFVNILANPLEQFLILPIFSFSLFGLNLFITNTILVLLFIIFCFFLLNQSLLNIKKNDNYLIPSNIQICFELLYKGVQSIVTENIKFQTNFLFFPLIFALFIFILFLNLIGMIPYSFTVTSHLSATLILSLTLFFGIQIISIKLHKLHFFSSFFPSGTSIFLGFLLVPIEIISFIFKPISLSIRLFANMMAGHTLLKVIAGFGWSLMNNSSGLLSVAQIVPTIILVCLFALESAVGIIQAFVFCVLICIYLNDSIILH